MDAHERAGVAGIHVFLFERERERSRKVVDGRDIILLRQKREPCSEQQWRAMLRQLLRPLPSAGEGSSAVHQTRIG